MIHTILWLAPILGVFFAALWAGERIHDEY
jgi:hypothetical protein